ncbi:uncharacterized protein KD926_003157 [Aspergillus affinis]|uniref:uncharacterized protein n=1 Tax=Aspergillus affinis TaxID=1070780 RepID=UPI0022FEBEFF|nr:uncharacterized protein KD926_003157 [Aspergillus affinis]KAI9035646.1 hypothetical protein KD926_003157 [Aspergillus affinis]
MWAIFNEREEKGEATKPVYGFLSDGSRFEFFQLNANLLDISKTLQWYYGPRVQGEIVSLLFFLFDEAALLSPTSSLEKMITDSLSSS